MSTIINGTSSAITFPDSTVQNTAALPATGGTLTGNLSVEGSVVATGAYALNADTYVYSWKGGTTGQVRSGIKFDGTNQIQQFYTAQAERMRIDSTGSLLVGKTSTAWTNDNGFTMSPSSADMSITHSTAKADGSRYIWFAYNTGQIGSISQSGTTAVAYNTTSDYRLKENVTPLNNALARVQALKPVTYTWKAAPDEIGEGFIAHELAEVCPQAVTGEKDAVDADGKPVYQGIDTSFLVATLTKAIQEQQAMIEELKAKVIALEAK